MYNDKELYELAEKVGRHLKSSGRKLTIAESCTGGWIAKAITDVPGSSQWFEYGFSVYADIAKRDLLGIDINTLEAEGAVSQPIVTAMAESALDRAKADVAVAVSGVAGPDASPDGKAIGTVWMCWSSRRGQAVESSARIKFFKGDREQIRRYAVGNALKGLLKL
ncbi:MAG: nicotinamide-nucleotide amidohydrolase family protein [Proteobacteria bacterium]|nr:nicotinamide-nucleotide amidohydrolase family protein [Pseudomonadota bacterium]